MPTAVVTGADSGIANAFARVLLQEGYKVFAVDRNQGQGLHSLENEGAQTSILDVTTAESIQDFKNTQLKDEPLDLLLNIAGVAAGPEVDSLEESTLDIFEKTFAVNTFGPFFLSQALLPNLQAAKNAKIGIVSSRVGSIGDNSSGGHYAYRSSKAAVNSIGKSMAMNLQDQGITVLLLHPGYVQTNILPATKMPPETVQPKEAAEKLWQNVVKVKSIDETGTFWHREGFELPW